jgi:hypothetical protein
MKDDMGKKVDLNKLRSIGSLSGDYKNSTRNKPHRDDQGRLDGGKEVEHWDGRQDAHIKAKAIAAKLNVTGG